MNDDLLVFVNFWILTPVSLLFRAVLLLFICTALRRLWVQGKKSKKVTVVVLGDVGRSPRMSYHSLSLAQHGFNVNLVGYCESPPHQQILESPKIVSYPLTPCPAFKGVPKIAVYFFKVLFQALNLIWVLIWNVGASEFILVQNPPCIPTLAVCLILSVFNGSKLIIDWHNYGYSILALSLKTSHPLVKIAKWYEELFGQLSTGNLCVTNSMRKDLQKRWHICAEVMHDRPSTRFKQLDLKAKHELFVKLQKSYPEFACDNQVSTEETRFTSRENDQSVSLKPDRPALIISSTSWTDDEDFSVLLDALQSYEEAVDEGNSKLPNLLCAITGKGPNKAYYQELIASKCWQHVQVITPWLEADDYPKLLACGDLGVSLHTSSSGLDLPMKVVDMFGCGLPVAAINFTCLDELVQKDVNGFVFESPRELCQQFQQAFDNFPHNQQLLSKFRDNIKTFRERTWDIAWKEIALPMFK